MKKKFLAILVCLIMVLGVFPATAFAVGPELALKDNKTGDPATSDTDYTYDLANGILTIIKDGDYTLSMAENIETTSHRVVVDSASDPAGQVKLTLDNVHIEGSYEGNISFGPGVLTIEDDTVLTLVGKNSLINNNNTAAAFGIYQYLSPLQITGSGSLDIEAPNGIGIFMYRNQITVTGGKTTITATQGISYDSDDNKLGNYSQSGGSVSVTASVNTAVFVNSFNLSGGSFKVDGTSQSTAISVRAPSVVSGGNLTISGDFSVGIASYSERTTGIEPVLNPISFTGGVTDITLDADLFYTAVGCYYSEEADPDNTETPPNPEDLLIIGSNMRITEGGKLGWNAFLVEYDDSTLWHFVNSIYDTEAVNKIASRVRIEPIPLPVSSPVHTITGASAPVEENPNTGAEAGASLAAALVLLSAAGMILKKRK